MKTRLNNARDIGTWLPILALSVAAAILSAIAVSRLLYPYDVGHYEGGIWAPAQLLVGGVNPYQRALTLNAPYVMAPYGVLYYTIIGAGLKFFGLKFWFARLLSALCVAICAACIAKLTSHFTKDKTASLLGPLLFFAQFPVQSWIGVQRPDLLALALSLGGITVALLNTDSPRSPLRAVLWPALLIAAAILARQTAILPIFVVASWYLMNGRRAHCAAFLGAVFVLLLIVFLGLNATSGGGYLWQQFTLPSSVGKSVALGIEHISALFKAPVTFAILLLWFVGWLQARLSETASDAVAKNYRRLLYAYLIPATALAAVTSSRIGSNINYWLEVSAAVALLVPLYWTDIATTVLWRKRRAALLVLVTLAFSFTGLRVCRGEMFRWRALPYFREIVANIERLTPAQQPSFSVYPELVALAGRPYYFNDYIQYDGRSPAHHQLFVDVMQAKNMAAIVALDKNPPAGYRRVQLSQPVPEKFIQVYLFVRE